MSVPFRVNILTIFPEMFEGFFSSSILGRAREQGIPCFWWDCGFFSLFDRHTGAVTRPALVRALMPG